MPQIAIVIATYNRADLLRLAIESCCQQEGVAPSDYEIIVVDNNCTDHTPQVVAEMQAAYPHVALRRIEERTPGVSYARNAVVGHIATPWIAYMDDDAKLPPEYVKIAFKWIETVKTDFVVLNGPIRAFTTTPIPAWYKPEWDELHYGDTAHELLPNEQFWASNMLLSHRLLKQTNGFPTTVGPAGDDFTIIGEESLYILHLRELQPAPLLFYIPELYLYHYLPAYKMRVRYRLKRRLVTGQTQPYLEYRHLNQRQKFIKLLGALKGLFVLSVQALFNRKHYTHRELWWVEGWGDAVQKLGLVLTLMGIRLKLKR